MVIETLQIKRVTGNWDTHKKKRPEKGELVMISLTSPVDGVPNGLVLGDGTKTLGELINDASSRIVTKELLTTDLTNKISDCKPAASSVPSKISSGEGDRGTDTGKFAFEGHIHQLDRATAETILGVSDTDGDFRCRRVKVGNLDTPSGGSVGDIYIKI